MLTLGLGIEFLRKESMNIYEQYGRLVEQYQTECEAHRNTISVLRRLKQGEITLDSVTVTDENQWAILPDLAEEPIVEMPAN